MKFIAYEVILAVAAAVPTVFLHKDVAGKDLVLHEWKNFRAPTLNFKVAGDCTCTFHDTCSCDSALDFMSCIQAACTSDKCKCDDEGLNFMGACNRMKATCDVGLQCSQTAAVCGAKTVLANGTAAAKVVKVSTAAPFESEEVPQTVQYWKEQAEERKEHGHRLIGFLLLTLLLAMLLFFTMAQSGNKLVCCHAWSVFDAVNVTIIGVSLFTIIGDIFENLEKDAEGIVNPEWAKFVDVLLHVIFALLLFFIALFGAYELKDSPRNMAIFNAIIYWCVVMSKGGAIAEAQRQVGGGVPIRTMLVTFASLVALVLLMVVAHHFKPAPRWYDDVENKLIGGVACMAFAEVINLLIHMRLVEEHGDMAVPHWEKALYSNSCAILSLLLAIYATHPLVEMQKRYATSTEPYSYFKWRLSAILVQFLGTLPYFMVSVGLALAICHRLGVEASTLMAKVIHAMSGTLMGAACIYACAFIPYLQSGTDHAEELKDFIAGFGGFQAGHFWSTLITGAGKDVLSGSGLEGFHLKFAESAIGFGILAVHVPVYIFHIKPLIEKTKSECTGK